MKKYLFCFLVGVTSIVLNSCDNVAEKKQREREKAIADSIQQREAFVRDSIAFVADSIAKVEAELLAAKKDEIIKKSKKLFNEKKDEFKNTTWVEPKTAPKYRNQNGIYAYFSIKDEKPQNFRFVFQYFNDDWLFIRSMIFNIDGENITITPKMERDNGNGDIWEWFDMPVTSELNIGRSIHESFIKKLAYATNVKVRMEGSQYYDTRTMSKKQIESIKATYEYYLALGGEF